MTNHPHLKVCYLGRISSPQQDEGMKNVLAQISDKLPAIHSRLMIDPRRMFQPSFWKELVTFKPDIIHYLSGPTLISLLLLRTMKVILPSAKTIASTLHPQLDHRHDGLIRLLKPDIVIACSNKMRRLFFENGCRVEMVPLGVDTGRFIPPKPDEKAKLRSEYGIPGDKYLLLHIGHLRAKRGLGSLARLQTKDQQVLVVGSTEFRGETRLIDHLKKSGCIVWRRYIPDIVQIYQLADCYIFPTHDEMSAIQLPLTILEAMSCNLPVITTPFGGLPTFFSAGSGLVYNVNPDEFGLNVEAIRQSGLRINTREMVAAYDWLRIVRDFEGIYYSLAE